MKRLLKRIALGVLLLLGAIIAVGAIWEQLAQRAAIRRFPAPGKLVDIGGRRIQLDCRGSGAPTVVLIHGLDVGGAVSWSAVHDSIARTTRTCAYSRAGIMWSDPTPAFTPTGMVADLHAALAGGGERPPFVLVGHSLGGPISLLYTKHRGDEVAGLVMVDASHPEQFDRFKQIGISTENVAIRVLEIAAALSWTGVGRLMTGQIQPMPHQPMDVVLAQRAWAPRSIRGAITEMKALGVIFAEAATARTLGDRPLMVLTAMKPMSAEQLRAAGITEEQARNQKKLWLEMHQEEAAWSTAGRQVVVPDASHYIQFDRPDRVIDAVAEVVAAARARSDSLGNAPAASDVMTQATTTVLPGPDGGKEAFEPSIAIDPDNPDRIVAAAMFGNPSARGGTGIWTWESRDGGRTWSSQRMRPPTIGAKPSGWAADVIAGFARDGAAVLTSMAGARDPRRDGLGGIVVSRRASTDTAWNDAVSVMRDRAAADGERAISYDKPWMAIDRDETSRFRGSVYVVAGALDLVLPAKAWAENPTDLSRLAMLGLDFAASRDGGASFGPARRVADSVFGADLTVGRGGTVEMVFPKTSGGKSAIAYLRSADGGASFEPPAVIATGGEGITLSGPLLSARADGTSMACWTETTKEASRIRCALRAPNAPWQAAAIGVPVPRGTTFAFPALVGTAKGWYLLLHLIGPTATDVVLLASDGRTDFRQVTTLATVPGLGLARWCFTRECRFLREDLFLPGDYASLVAAGGRLAAGFVLPRPGGSLAGRAAVQVTVMKEPE